MKKSKYQIGSCKPEHVVTEGCYFTQHESPGILVKFITILLLTTLSTALTAQVGVNTDGSSPDTSAILDVKSVEKGFLPPRLTLNERDAIANPAEGLVIYNRDYKVLQVFNGSVWMLLPGGGFRCGVSQVEDDNGNFYNTVQIGTQCWMAKSLRTGVMINGDADQTDNGITEKYCYNNETSNCDTYGGLYKWAEMMHYDTIYQVSRGICPYNWHIPSHDEWSTLINHLGSDTTSGGPMKTTGTLESGTGLWHDPNTGATNSSGFSGLPGGYLFDLWEEFRDINSVGYFWTSTTWGDPDWGRAWHIELGAGYANVHLYPMGHKLRSYSVRCIKDQ